MRRFQPVEKVQMRPISCKSLAEFRRPQTTEGSEICFFRRHVRRKKHCSARKRASKASATQRAASLRARACTCERACRQSRQAQKAPQCGAFFDLIEAAVRPTADAQKRVRFWGPGGRLHILRASELPLRQGPGQGPGRLGAPDGAARCARAAGCDRCDTKGKGGGSL